MKDEVLEYIEKSVLCWLATVDKSGAPNVSPKEIFVYGGNGNLLIAHIASPNSVENIAINSRVCVSFIDVFEQRGFKLKGNARLLNSDDMSFEECLAKLRVLADERFPIHAIIDISVDDVSSIKAPSYFLFPDVSVEQQIESALKTYGVVRK